MRSKQRGVTFIGWLVLLVPWSICIYAGIRLAPIYLNYMKVARALTQIKNEYNGGGVGGDNVASVRLAVEKRFFVESVDFPDVKDVKITRVGHAWQIEANYDDTAPLLSNVSMLVSFDKTVTVGSAGGE